MRSGHPARCRARPAVLPGASQIISAVFEAEPRIAENFRTGRGLDWGEHDGILIEGTERFFRPNYVGNLVGSWIPAPRRRGGQVG